MALFNFVEKPFKTTTKELFFTSCSSRDLLHHLLCLLVRTKINISATLDMQDVGLSRNKLFHNTLFL